MPVFFFSIVSYSQFVRTVDIAVKTELEKTAESLSVSLGRVFGTANFNLATLAAIIESVPFQNEVLKRVLSRVLESNTLYTTISLIDLEGRILIDPNRPYISSCTDSDLINKVKIAKEFKAGVLQIEPLTGLNVIPVAYPVFFKNMDDLAYILYLNLDLNIFNQLLTLDEAVRKITVLDGMKNIILEIPAAENTEIGKNFFNSEEFKEHEDTILQDNILKDEILVDELGVYSIFKSIPMFRFDESGPLIFIEFGNSSFVRELNRIHNINIILLISSTILSLILAYILSHYFIVRHINSLSCLALSYGRGQRTMRSSLNSSAKEITQFEKSFNEMAELIQQKENELQGHIDERTVLLKEIHHRVKNNFQIINSLLSIQEDVFDSKEMQNVFQESRQRIFSMALVHEILYNTDHLDRIQLRNYMSSLIANIQSLYSDTVGDIRLFDSVDDIDVEMDKAIPIGLIINESVSNCYKHAFNGRASGSITVVLKKSGKNLKLQVSDDGVGIDGSEDKHNSIGMVLLDALSIQLGCRLKIESECGTSISMEIPLVK